MIGVIATIRVHEGQGAAFEAFFKGLADEVRAREPGCLTYHLNRSRTDQAVYKVMEVYKDQEALSGHSKTDYFQKAQSGFATYLAERPTIEILDVVV